eukprot:1146135-Pelagomonas_calceolata.AAC.26
MEWEKFKAAAEKEKEKGSYQCRVDASRLVHGDWGPGGRPVGGPMGLFKSVTAQVRLFQKHTQVVNIKKTRQSSWPEPYMRGHVPLQSCHSTGKPTSGGIMPFVVIFFIVLVKQGHNAGKDMQRDMLQ